MTHFLFSVYNYQQPQKDTSFGTAWNSINGYASTKHCESNVHTSSCSVNEVLNFLTITREHSTKTFMPLAKRQSKSLLNLKFLSSFATCHSMSSLDLSKPNKLNDVPISNEISDISFIDEEEDKSLEANQGKIEEIIYKNIYDLQIFIDQVIDFIHYN